MKKKIVVRISILLAVMFVAIVYYFTPKTFGKNVTTSSVDHINVFDGNTGVGFTIDDSEDIRYIVENIQSTPMRRGGVSLGRMGYRFSIEYVDKNEKAIIPVFFLNSDKAIRKDPFFYYCDGGLCIDYLMELESQCDSTTK